MAKTPTRNTSATLIDQSSENDDRCKNLLIYFYFHI